MELSDATGTQGHIVCPTVSGDGGFESGLLICGLENPATGDHVIMVGVCVCVCVCVCWSCMLASLFDPIKHENRLSVCPVFFPSYAHHATEC